MIKVKLVDKEQKYCTHCDSPALYVMYFSNPKVVQQGSNGALCSQCMERLKVEIDKVTSPKKPVKNRDK